MVDLIGSFIRLFGPQQQEDGLLVQEQTVGGMVQLLSAKIP